MNNSQAIYLCYSYNTNINSDCLFVCKRFGSLNLAKKHQECLNQPPQISNPIYPSQISNPIYPSQISNPIYPSQIFNPIYPPQIFNPIYPVQLAKPSSTIITVCKYIPQQLHVFVIRYKLSKHFFGIRMF